MKGCPFCGRMPHPRTEGLTHEVIHKADCFMSLNAPILDAPIYNDNDEYVQIFQDYELEHWNRRECHG